MDLSQFAVDGLVVVAVYILVNIVIKPLIDIWVMPTQPAHDPLIRGMAVLLGIVGIFADHGFPPGTDGHSWLLLAVSGILSGLSAVGFYHVGQPTPGVVTGSATESAWEPPVVPGGRVGPALDLPPRVTPVDLPSIVPPEPPAPRP